MKKLTFIYVIVVMIVSCNMPSNNSNSMKADINKARMQQFYDDIINAHNASALDSFCTVEFIDHNPDPSHSGIGIDDVKANFKDFMTAYPDIHVSTNFMIAQGDTVMAHVTMTGTNTGPMGNMPATNKKFSMDGIDVVVLKDGKATERWGFFDNMKMMVQLGMMPSLGAAPDSAMTKTDGDKK